VFFSRACNEDRVDVRPNTRSYNGRVTNF
jgi:hypothetical protein